MLGCGTVGGGVVKLLQSNAAHIEKRLGTRLEIRRALVRSLDKVRSASLGDVTLTEHANELFGDRDLDIVVDVMGGVHPARALVERAIDAGCGVVSANKALLADCGEAILTRARSRGVDVAFEAAVGGGIPIVRVLREALVSDVIKSLAGIVNGTSNFILTKMHQEGASFEEALREAQARGYAEADPTLDVDGQDAAHKLVVLAMLAFGACFRPDHVHTEGIQQIEAIDHRFAERFGFAIKHLAIARAKETSGQVEMRVHPALVARDTPLANVNGVLNAIAIVGEALGPCLLSGQGAGALPTAVSVVADIVDVAAARLNGTAGLMTKSIDLVARPLMPMGEVEARQYVRLAVFDRPGVLAKITGTFSAYRVSIEQMIQEGGGDATGAPVQVVMLTHSTREREIAAALDEIANHKFVAGRIQRIRVF